MIDILAYNNASDLSRILHTFKGTNLRFIIPSRKDKFFFPLRDAFHDLWTWNDIYNDIMRASHSRKSVLSPPDHLMILRSILDEVLSLYRDKADSLPGIKRAGFLEVISTDIRELLNEAVSPGQLPHVPESDNPSEFLLPEVYSRYTDYLAANSLLDSAGVYTAALEALKDSQSWGRELSLVFTGFLSFTHGQLELVKALADRCEHITLIKPEANLEHFHDASSQFAATTHAPQSKGRIIELDVNEPDLEPEMTARTLALWASGELKDWGEFPGFDAIGLTVSEGREDSFSQAFTRYGIPHNFMSGIPISRTLPGKVLASLATLSTRSFPTYETAMLLTQPCFAGITFPVMSAYRAGRTGLDDWEEFLSGGEGEAFADALCAVRAIRKFCSTLDVKNTPVRIMEAFNDFLHTPGLWLNKKDKTALFPELDEATRQTASAIETIEHKTMSLLELMPDLGRVKDDTLSKEDAYNFLESWCRNTNTRAPIQLANSVRIFTGQPPVLASFPVWIMTGVTQKTWSSTTNTSPLLGTEERVKLQELDTHLPMPADKARQREAVFRRMLHTGEKLTLISRPLLDDEGRPTSESPFMQRFRDDAKLWTIAKHKTESEGINILLGGDGYIFPEIDASGKRERTVPVIKHKADTVGAGDINKLLFCPFVWWQERQAHIYDSSPELATPADWGNLLHKYWQCVWQRYSVNLKAPGQVFMSIASDEWKKLTGDRECESYRDFHRLFDSRLRRRLNSLKFRVDRLAGVQAAIIDGLHGEGWVHEKVLLEENAHLRASAGGVTFLGQCDRVEILTNPDGSRRAFIADYKTGTGEGYEAGNDISSFWWDTEHKGTDSGYFKKGLQLSVYAALFDECELSGVYILALETGQVLGTVEKSVEDIFKPYTSKNFSTDIQARINEGAYAMECAVRILEKGEFTPEYSSKLCEYCKVKSLCRRGEFRRDTTADEE